MKLLLTSDTHGYDIPISTPADVFIHAGDFTNVGKIEVISKFDTYLGTLETSFPGYFKEKIVIPGNHDLLFEQDFALAEALMTNATVLNQTAYQLGEYKVWGEPRQPEFCNWAFNVSHADMEFVWQRVPHDTDILVTHGPPYLCGDYLPHAGHVGCTYLRAWILEHQPKLVVCGHIHAGYGLYLLGNTLVVNASMCSEDFTTINKPIVITL